MCWGLTPLVLVTSKFIMLALKFQEIQSGAFPGQFGGNTAFRYNATIGEIVSSFLPYIFMFAGIALLIYLILGGFQLMLSRGDPKAIQSAQGKITNALIGFVIIIIAFLIVQLLGQLLGIKEDTVFGKLFGSPGWIKSNLPKSKGP
jgi:hypothetical protein